MFSTPVRVALLVLCLGLGSYRLLQSDLTGFIFFACAGLLVYGHFSQRPVWRAFREVRLGNLDRATELLSQAGNPARLSSEERAYFELASALIAAARGREEPAESHVRTALEHRMRTENDRGLAEALLGQLLFKRGALEEARRVLDQAASRDCKPQIAKMIAEIRQTL